MNMIADPVDKIILCVVRTFVGTYIGRLINDFRTAKTSRYKVAPIMGHHIFDSGVDPRCHSKLCPS